MWARVQNGVVREIIDFDPEGRFTNEIVAQFIKVPESVHIEQGWIYSEETFSPPIPPETTVMPTLEDRLNALELLALQQQGVI